MDLARNENCAGTQFLEVVEGQRAHQPAEVPERELILVDALFGDRLEAGRTTVHTDPGKEVLVAVFGSEALFEGTRVSVVD